MMFGCLKVRNFVSFDLILYNSSATPFVFPFFEFAKSNSHCDNSVSSNRSGSTSSISSQNYLNSGRISFGALNYSSLHIINLKLGPTVRNDVSSIAFG